MQAVQTIMPGVLADLIQRQPASNAKTAFAWSAAVGPAIARATSIELRGATLEVTARDARWARELDRNREVVLARLQHLLGAGIITRMTIVS